MAASASGCKIILTGDKLAPFRAEADRLRSLWREETVALYPNLAGKITGAVAGEIDPAGVPAEELYRIAHALGVLFQLYNLAEERHRARRIRIHREAQGSRPEKGSFEWWMGESPGEDCWRYLAQTSPRIVFTAHPTELRRPALLRNWNRLDDLLTRLETGESGEAVEREVRGVIRSLLVTGDIRRTEVTPYHEIRDLWAQLSMLWAGVGSFHRRLPVEGVAPLRFGCWVGVDADGNPNITPATMRYAAETLRRMALSYHLTDCEATASRLTATLGLADFPAAATILLVRLESEAPGATIRLGDRYRPEPLRRAIALVVSRLKDTLAALPDDPSLEGYEVVRRVEAVDPRSPYPDADSFIRDLEEIAAVSASVYGRPDPDLAGLIFKARIFGFHFATLEHRLHARDLLSALKAILPCGDEESLWREVILRAEAGHPLTLPELSTHPSLDRLAAAAGIRRDFGGKALDALILSGTSRVEEIVGLGMIADAAGISGDPGAPLFVAPLFETLSDLNNSPAILERLLALPCWRGRIDRSGGVQQIMLGYSDSGKDGGIVASTIALDRAATALLDIAGRAGVTVEFFHGRGGTIARGGGPLFQSAAATPAGVGAGRWKLTEQGEMIAARYSRPELAARVFEQLATATLAALKARRSGGRADPDPEMTARLAESSSRAFRALVYETGDFAAFFAAASPLKELQALKIGSRPAKRTGTDRIEDLRAIPWNFGWLQNRLNLPAWFGFGSAVDEILRLPGGLQRLQELVKASPLFQLLLLRLKLATLLTDRAAAQKFIALARGRREIADSIEAEFVRVVESLERLDGGALPSGYALFSASLKLREGALRSVAAIQTGLLERYRRQAGESVETTLQTALLQSVVAAAAGIRNSG